MSPSRTAAAEVFVTVTTAGVSPGAEEVPDRARLAGRLARLGQPGDRIRIADREAVAEGMRARAGGPGAGDADDLADRERRARHEARAVALRVGLETPGVEPARAAAHDEARQRRGRSAEKAELRRGHRVARAGRRRDEQRGAGQLRAGVEGRRNADRAARRRAGAHARRPGGKGGARAAHDQQRRSAARGAQRGTDTEASAAVNASVVV
jgi:hypothetical protein